MTQGIGQTSAPEPSIPEESSKEDVKTEPAPNILDSIFEERDTSDKIYDRRFRSRSRGRKGDGKKCRKGKGRDDECEGGNESAGHEGFNNESTAGEHSTNTEHRTTLEGAETWKERSSWDADASWSQSEA